MRSCFSAMASAKELPVHSSGGLPGLFVGRGWAGASGSPAETVFMFYRETETWTMQLTKGQHPPKDSIHQLSCLMEPFV